MTRSTTFDPREQAAQILQRVLHEDAYASRLVDHILDQKGWDARDQALLTELVYGILRNLLYLDHALNRFAKKGIDSIEPIILQHLRVAAYQLLFLDRIPAHAILHQAVNSVEALRGQRVAGFANALLRRLQEHKEQIHPPDPLLDLAGFLAIRHSHPRWLVERYLDTLGQERTQERLRLHNQAPPLTLRVHTPWGSRDDLFALLEAEGIEAEATAFSPDGIRITKPAGRQIQALLAKEPRAFVIQDEAAQCIARWLVPEDAQAILDACAAPGGKTTHLAALAPHAQIIAMDRHPQKLRLIEQACQRLAISNVRTQAADLTKPLDPSKQFDRILCDAPCSGLGTLRKNPEIRYRRQPEDLLRFAQTQSAILKQLAPLLKPDGLLIYAVCTDTTEESEGVIDTFLQEHPEFSLDSAPSPYPAWSALLPRPSILSTSPEAHQMDGFFAARLRKQAR
jgi:16S rRNA (cytosine967-C5)-methyltransferase